jgi:hypothetical protein
LAGTAYFRTSKLIACVACIVGTAIVISRDEVFFAAVVACIVGIACTVGTVFVASRDDDVSSLLPLSSPSGMGFWSLRLWRCLYRRHYLVDVAVSSALSL